MKVHIFILYFALLCLFTSCGENYILEENFNISNTTWTYSDSMLVEIPVEDTEQRYNLYLDIDHSVEYSYQNLYVRINTQFPSGARVQDMVSLELADDMGQWHGSCNSESCTLRIVLQEHIYFKEKGGYQISIEQYMRDAKLEGIHGLSFKLAKSDK